MNSTNNQQLGVAQLPATEIEDIFRTALGDAAAEIEDWWVSPVDYVSGVPSTGALMRVSCRARSGSRTKTVSVFLKVLQSAKHWPHVEMIPEFFREEFIASLPWRIEIDARESGVETLLPDGLRLPQLFRSIDLPDERAAMWTEFIEVSGAPWTQEHYARAARALGRLAARRREGVGIPFRNLPESKERNGSLRYYRGKRVDLAALPAIADDALWTLPPLTAALEATGESSLQADLRRASLEIDATLDALDLLPQAYAHGDASPQNLLVEENGDDLVVIDWGFDSLHSIGFDLGQLLLGLANVGELSADDLEVTHDVIFHAYCDGLADESWEVTASDVRFGFIGSMFVRSAFTALPFPILGGTGQESTDEWVQRVRMTRFMLDKAAEVGITA